VRLWTGPSRHAVTRARHRGAALAVAGDMVWALGTNDGSVVAVDGNSGRVVYRLARVAPVPDTTNALVVDAAAAWVVSTNHETLVRIVGGRVVQRIPVRSALGPVAVADGAVWVATGDNARFGFSLSRIDPETGRATATLDLGLRLPKALVP
jgi:outer membrane protein assembly factor BamB